MKTIRIIGFILLIISNIVFFIYGWIVRIDCDNQRSINEKLQYELLIKDQEIMKLKNELEDLN